MRTCSSTCMRMHARMRRLVWSGDGTTARGKICACAFLVIHVIHTHGFGSVECRIGHGGNTVPRVHRKAHLPEATPNTLHGRAQYAILRAKASEVGGTSMVLYTCKHE